MKWAADEIEKEFGINVGRQLNVIPGLGFGAEGGSSGLSHNDRGIMSDEEYFRRYGRPPGGEGRKFSAGSGIEARLPLPDNAPFRLSGHLQPRNPIRKRSIVSFSMHSAG